MSFIFFIFVFVLGAALGSFLNVAVIRLRAGVSVLGRSRCGHCQTQLKPKHLVPILSWLCLRGRCAFCGRRIHIQYPLVELSAALLFVVTYLRQPWFMAPAEWSVWLFESLLWLVFLALVVFDLRWQLLPIEPMIVASALVLVWHAVVGDRSGNSLLIGMLVPGVFLGAQTLVSRGRWLGGGDPWLGLLMGAFLGWPLVGLALYLAYVVGGLLIAILWLFGIVRRGTRIPFAPLLVGGTLGAWLLGETGLRELIEGIAYSL